MMKLERELIGMQPEEFARLFFIVTHTYDDEDRRKYNKKMAELSLREELGMKVE